MSSDTVIGQMEVSFVIEYKVLRLNVPMDNASGMGGIESLQQTCYHELCLVMFEFPDFTMMES